MRVAAVSALGLVIGAACGKPLFTPPSRLGAFGSDDPRHEVVGRWQVEFARGDSVARGELELTDSVGSPINRTLRGQLTVDLAPLFGEPMLCLESGSGSVWVDRSQTMLGLTFATRATHCWLSASTTWYGDSAVGEWARETQVGELFTGRFRMWRLPSP